MNATSRILFALSCGAALNIGHAQATPSGFDAFTKPTGTMRCRSQTATHADSADILYNFVDGDGMQLRETTVAFDSLGTPLYLALFSPEVRSTGTRVVHALAVRFGKPSKGSHIILPLGSGGDSPAQSDTARANASTQPSEEAFTEADGDRALLLAVWLWEHRCHDARVRGG